MKELVNQFIQIRQDLLNTASSFPADKLEQAICGVWDIRCVLAHIAGWDIYFTKIVKLLRAEQDIPPWGDIDEFNKISVQERKGKTWDQVRDEFAQAGEAFIQEYSNLEEPFLSKRFWEQSKLTAVDMVKINVHHYTEHLQGIKEKLDEEASARK